ncbi:hypothetical protein [Streptomyces sp. NBC_01615]|uniref:hypothetical protein n=1 Tax=Streptomyces sp. NBC_01615 TaxID=2975898 RepID=UPI0038708755
MTRFPGALLGAELAAALNAELGKECPHRFTAPQGRPGSSLVSIDGGRSRLGAIAGDDAYVITFVRDDQGRAHGATRDKRLLADAACAWLAGTGLEEMAARWPFVEFSELQLALERGDALETQWRILRRDASELDRELVEAAAADATVSRFYPILDRNLLFTPGPSDKEVLASVSFQSPGRFRLCVPGRPEALADGDPNSVITRLAEFLDSLEG